MMPVADGDCRWRSWPSALSRHGPPSSGWKQGIPPVSIGIYAAVLLALGLLNGLSEIADISTATWRGTAKAVGARSAEITRMASAFEHDDLRRALVL